MLRISRRNSISMLLQDIMLFPKGTSRPWTTSRSCLRFDGVQIWPRNEITRNSILQENIISMKFSATRTFARAALQNVRSNMFLLKTRQVTGHTRRRYFYYVSTIAKCPNSDVRLCCESHSKYLIGYKMHVFPFIMDVLRTYLHVLDQIWFDSSIAEKTRVELWWCWSRNVAYLTVLKHSTRAKWTTTDSRSGSQQDGSGCASCWKAVS